MPNSLTITVEQPDVILNAGQYGAGALVILEWSATEAGTYAAVTGTGSTPTIPVVTGVRAYSGFDPAGTGSTWYRTRFENAATTRLSEWSDPFQSAPEGSGLVCSLWDVQQELGVSAGTDDELLLEKIRQITDEIHHLTGRLFTRSPASGDAVWTFDADRFGRALSVPKGIASITTLEVATTSQPETAGTYDTVTAGDWFLRPTATDREAGWPATRIELSDQSAFRFYAGYNTVQVTGALGWDTVPYDIQAIGQRATIASYLSKGSGAGGVTAVGPSGGMMVLRNISPSDRETLKRYAVLNVA